MITLLTCKYITTRKGIFQGFSLLRCRIKSKWLWSVLHFKIYVVNSASDLQILLEENKQANRCLVKITRWINEELQALTWQRNKKASPSIRADKPWKTKLVRWHLGQLDETKRRGHHTRGIKSLSMPWTSFTDLLTEVHWNTAYLTYVFPEIDKKMMEVGCKCHGRVGMQV